MLRFLRRFAVIVVLIGASGEIDRGEFLCEEAHAKLKSCCGSSFRTSTSFCTKEGCAPPILSEGTSECILAKSCDEIVKGGICSRAMDFDSGRSSDDAGTVEVCR